MLRRMIELHDSKVAGIQKIGNQLIVFFSKAYVHQSKGEPGRDAGSGWVQAAALVFAEGMAVGDGIAEWPADIWDGHLVVEGVLLNNQIPVPFEEAGKVELRLQLDTPAEVTVRGRGVCLRMLGDPVYVEEFPGARAG